MLNHRPVPTLDVVRANTWVAEATNTNPRPEQFSRPILTLT